MRRLKIGSLGILALIGLMMAGCGGGGGGAASSTSHELSGTVTSSAVGLPGAKVLLSGDVATKTETLTDANGKFAFKNLSDGNYTVSLAYSDYTAKPVSRTLKGADILDANLTAVRSSKVFYMVDDQGRLGTVDIASGAVTVIGTTRTSTGTTIIMTDIDFDPDGNLYGVSPQNMYRINKADASLTDIGSHSLSYANSLVFNNIGGQAYTADQSLFTIDAVTGSTKRLGNGGSAYDSTGDLAFIENDLYLTSKVQGDPADSSLIRLNMSTGVGSLVGLIGYPNVFGTASNDNVNLYGFSENKVFRINTATGEGEEQYIDISGNGFSNINGAAFYQEW